MRTRKEIERQIKKSEFGSMFGGGGLTADTNSILILEVCLDIRDLLIEEEQS